MKRICIVLGLLFVLCACERQIPAVTTKAPEITAVPETTAVPVTTAASETTAVTAGNNPSGIYAYDGVYLSEVDFAAYRDRLTKQQNEELDLYLPVLQNEQTFRWQNQWEGRMQDAKMSDVYASFWSMEGNPPDDLMAEGFAMVDIDGDNANEFVLYLNDIGGHYLVLHHTDDGVYGIDFPIRCFFLMDNGVYMGSGGAATHWYYTLKFENGQFVETEIGSIDERLDENAEIYGGKYTINGVKVSKEEFNAWEKNIRADDVEYIFLD